MTIARFRWLLAISMVSGLAALVIEVAVPGLVPSELARAYDKLPSRIDGLSLAVLSSLMLLLVVVHVVLIVGLFFLKPWSRSLALWLTALSLLASFLLGPELLSAPASGLIQVSLISWGGLLGAAYFSELRPYFDTKTTDS